MIGNGQPKGRMVTVSSEAGRTDGHSLFWSWKDGWSVSSGVGRTDGPSLLESEGRMVIVTSRGVTHLKVMYTYYCYEACIYFIYCRYMCTITL